MNAPFTPLVFASCAFVTLSYTQDHIVSSNADSGMDTLRQAIAEATDFDVIGFAPNMSGAIITLTSGELGINKRLTIDGSALAPPVTITATGSRVFLTGQEDVVLDSLVIDGGEAPNATGGSPAERGGGILNLGELEVRNCTIQNSTAGDGGFTHPDGGNGGGIANVGDLVIENSTITGNTGGDADNNGDGGSGAGIYNDAGSTLTIRNSTVYDNTSGAGDGIGNGGSGGGIASLAPLTLANVTIANNASGPGGLSSGLPGVGGGLRAFSISNPLVMENTLIAGNREDTDENGTTADIDLHPVLNNNTETTTTGVNLIGINGGGSGAFPAPGNPGDPNSNGDLVGIFGAPLDPGLGAFGFTGGTTPTVLLQSTSPAVDPIDGEATSSFSITLDQRGFPRVVNGVIDIGAVEFDAENQAARDAAAAAALAAQQAAARAAQIGVLQNQIKKLKKKAKNAKRKGQVAKAKKFKKKIKKLNQQIRSL